ncbi:hypothetical protein SAMN05421663_10936 [Terribacillus halophilus]|uniref:Stage III sporulation protein AH n=1 Tax=Terribacillus halophilus TaxID=361279 RepID=A0A1G6TSN1_9BACI|nr:hypothetical protein [Terribacillus halophilus]SDD32080.1 hypothetical protein SAMN05421663_10936 [Terribacillus halophilus]
MFEIIETDILAEAYESLMERLCDVCDTFTFAVLPKKMMGQKQTLHTLLESLEPYLKKIEYTNGTRANLFQAHISVPNYYYHFNKESLRLIVDAADSLFYWQQPLLPEDISFLRKDKEYFTMNAHEGYAMLFAEDRYVLELGGTKWSRTN